MPNWDIKTGFALLCLLAMLAVGAGALLEINRTRRGESIITLNHLRLRVLSAVVWMLILGSMACTLLVLWPEAGDERAKLRFLSVTSGIFLLLIIGLLLLLYDVWRVSLQRRQQQKRFEQQRNALARAEIEKQHRVAQRAVPDDVSKDVSKDVPDDVSS